MYQFSNIALTNFQHLQIDCGIPDTLSDKYHSPTMYEYRAVLRRVGIHRCPRKVRLLFGQLGEICLALLEFVVGFSYVCGVLRPFYKHITPLERKRRFII